MTLIELFIALVCYGGVCHTDRIYVTPVAMAIASCESGDGYHFGTYDFTARNVVTGDGGAWQFNDKTAMWIFGTDHAERLAPATQYDGFVRLWDDGYGWRHWVSSKRCWSQWITINSEGRAVYDDSQR